MFSKFLTELERNDERYGFRLLLIIKDRRAPNKST